MSEAPWYGYAIGMLTATFAPIIKDYIVKIMKKPNVSVAIIGTKQHSSPRGWEIVLSIINKGDKSDTIEAAYAISDKNPGDKSNYAMDLKDGEVWRFQTPIDIPQNSCIQANVRFWVHYDNPPDTIRLKFLSGRTLNIDIKNGKMIKFLFENSAAGRAWEVGQLKMENSDITPFWFHVNDQNCFRFYPEAKKEDRHV